MDEAYFVMFGHLCALLCLNLNKLRSHHFYGCEVSMEMPVIIPALMQHEEGGMGISVDSRFDWIRITLSISVLSACLLWFSWAYMMSKTRHR